MYQVLSIITVPEPLSAAFITMSCRCLSWCIACRSEVVRLSRIGLGLHVVMSSLTASKNVSRACSLLVGGFQVLLLWKELSRLFTLVVLFSSKKYSVSRIRRAKSYMSAEISGQLMCLGVGQNVRPRARTNISSGDRVELERLITDE